MGSLGPGGGGEPLGKGGREPSWGVQAASAVSQEIEALPCPSLRSHVGGQGAGNRGRGEGLPERPSSVTGSDCLLQNA